MFFGLFSENYDEVNKMRSAIHVSVLLFIMNFVITLSKQLWIHEAIADWIRMKNWRPCVFYDNKLSNCPLSLVAPSHKL